MYPKSNNMTKIIETSKGLLKRDFDVQGIQKFFSQHGFLFWSWGVSSFSNLMNKGLLMKVNGHHHKGYVLVVLDYSDTFDVYFISTHGNIIDQKHLVYIDMLFDVIDNRIEKIPEYVR